MEPFHDIYRKEDPSSRRYRRKKPHTGKYNPEADHHTAASSPNGDNPASRADLLNHKSSHRRHHHHRTAPGENSPLGRILWIALAVIFVVYALFLVVSILRRMPAEAAAKAAVEAVDTNETAVAEEMAAEARALQDRVNAWKKIPDAILAAQSLQDRGLLQQAGDNLARALESAPSSARLQVKLAQINMARANLPAAKETLLNVLEANPDDSLARQMLGSVYIGQTNYPAALIMARWILETDPVSVAANQMAADAYLNMDNRGQAIPHLRRIITLERDNTVAQNRLGRTYAQMGEYVKAIQLFSEVLQKNPSDSVTYFNLASCYARQGMADQAVEILSRAAALFGDDFVSTLIRNSDFDPVRGEAIFSAFSAQVSKKTPPQEAEGSAEAPGAGPANPAGE